ncbi:rhomboid family intramembrane serine protease [Nocardioidaceae bacterium SCSIO 66511]|nr:rhomboid family intramembrane serine protease [Nocardioidaceae bacterium SCSIO 66511]
MSEPADAAPSTPYCYRHPDRETYIRCQRCGRPICPDCMRQASVGYQCPDCVAEGARTIRQPRTVAGGLTPTRAGIVSYALIAINVVVFLAQLATGGTNGTVTEWGAMLTGTWRGSDGAILHGVDDGGWWRIVTSGFLHLGLLHILFNMYALFLFGPMLERMLGHLRFIVMYASSLVAGSLAVYLFADYGTLTAGASGAIFGLLGCTLVLFLKHGYDVRFLLGLLAINAALPLFAGGISWQAHAGGFVAGAVCGAVFAYAPQKARVYLQAGGIAVVWIALAVGFALRTAQLTA